MMPPLWDRADARLLPRLFARVFFPWCRTGAGVLPALVERVRGCWLAWRQGISKRHLDAFFAAVEAGEAVAVRQELASGLSPDLVNGNGRTGLLQAAQRGHLSVVLALIEAGASVDKADKDRITPLMSACRSGHLDAVRALHRQGADLTAVNRFRCDAFVWAAKYGQLDVVRWLLDRPVSTDRRDKGNRSALDLALLFRRHEIIDLLSDRVPALLTGRTLQECCLYALETDNAALLERALPHFGERPAVLAFDIPLLAAAVAMDARACHDRLRALGHGPEAADAFGINLRALAAARNIPLP